MRVVQLTPPGSSCSIVIGEGMPLGEPGTTKGAQLVVDDIDAAREELLGRGLKMTEVQQLGPEGAPGSRFAFFADPDCNGWSIQEFKRLLGQPRTESSRRLESFASAARLLPTAAPQMGEFDHASTK